MKDKKAKMALALIIIVFLTLITSIVVLWPTKEKVAINYIRTTTQLLDEYANDHAENNIKVYPKNLEELYMTGYNDSNLAGQFFKIKVEYIPQLDFYNNLYTGYILKIDVNGYKQQIVK